MDREAGAGGVREDEVDGLPPSHAAFDSAFARE